MKNEVLNLQSASAGRSSLFESTIALTAIFPQRATKMEVSKECYRFFIETLRRNGKTQQEIHQLLQTAWGDESPSLATIYRLYSEFSTGSRGSFQDGERTGRPKSACTAEKVDEINMIIQCDPRVTVDELATETGICHGSVYNILTVNLQLTSRCSRWVPHQLSVTQKHQRVIIAQEWLDAFNNFSSMEELSQRIVVIDKKFFYQRSVGRKVSNRTWNIGEEDRLQIPRQTMFDAKNHVICAITFSGKYHFEVLENKETINSMQYMSFLQDMQGKFVHSRNSPGWKKMILIQDNARPHTSMMTTAFLASKGVRTLKQPPYSPDFNLCDRWLFSKLELLRARKNFTSREELVQFLHEEMGDLERDAVQNQLTYLKMDLVKIIAAGGDYL